MAPESMLIRALRAALRAQADPEKAAAMQAYMKSAMPYYGIQTTEQRRIYRDIFARWQLASYADWRDTVLKLWRTARYREERYAAIELTQNKRYAAFQTLETLPLYEELIVTGAWWDLVDSVAAHRVGALLRRYPDAMKPEMRTWSRCDNLWKRRSSILCQLTFKNETDLLLLYECIEPSLTSREFFLRKAIGWALRQYAWTDPHEIVRYVRRKHRELSPLSKREALKNVLRSGLIHEIPSQ
jgi:3-methyladenine DNA glycosylase AlkD